MIEGRNGSNPIPSNPIKQSRGRERRKEDTRGGGNAYIGVFKAITGRRGEGGRRPSPSPPHSPSPSSYPPLIDVVFFFHVLNP